MYKRLNNLDFKPIEFEGIKNQAGLPQDEKAGGQLMKIQNNLKSQIVTSSWGRRSDEPFKVTNCDLKPEKVKSAWMKVD